MKSFQFAARKGIGILLLVACTQVIPVCYPARAQEKSPAQTQPNESPDQPEEPFDFSAPSEAGVPSEYLEGTAYLGNFREAWSPGILSDPDLGSLFLAAQSGASRQDLEKQGLPDLDLALDDLMATRMLRLVGTTYRPAFPILRDQSEAALREAVRKAGDAIYPDLRPYLKKAQKAAKKEMVTPWLFALLWAEVFESRGAEEMLIDAGALDARRMHDEGYFWIQIPRNNHLLSVDRYGSGSETLHYVWSSVSDMNPALQDFFTRRLVLDGSLAHLPWTDPKTEEEVRTLGVLDARKNVVVPALRKRSALLGILRQASQLYVKRALAALRGGDLAKKLGLPRDEAFAIAFSNLGSSLLEQAKKDGWAEEPGVLVNAFAPSTDTLHTLVTTAEEAFRPLDRAYYLYDRGDYEASVRQAREYLEGHPRDPEGFFRMGIAYMKMRKYPEALEAFDKGIAVPAAAEDVWKGWLYLRAGNTLDMLDRREDALARYRQAIHCADINGSREIARQWLENVYRD